MKLFKVTIDSYGPERPIQPDPLILYVTAETDTMLEVVNYYTSVCEGNGDSLKSVEDVLTITKHIGDLQSMLDL